MPKSIYIASRLLDIPHRHGHYYSQHCSRPRLTARIAPRASWTDIEKSRVVDVIRLCGVVARAAAGKHVTASVQRGAQWQRCQYGSCFVGYEISLLAVCTPFQLSDQMTELQKTCDCIQHALHPHSHDCCAPCNCVSSSYGRASEKNFQPWNVVHSTVFVSSGTDMMTVTVLGRNTCCRSRYECQDTVFGDLNHYSLAGEFRRFRVNWCLHFHSFDVLSQVLPGKNEEMYQNDRRGVWMRIRALDFSSKRQQCYPRDLDVR